MGPISMENAEKAQTLLLRDWQSATVIGLAVAVAVLFAWLMRTNYLRAKDSKEYRAEIRELAKEVAAHVERNAESNFTLARAVDDLRPKKPKAPT